MKPVAISNLWERLKRQVSLKRRQPDSSRPQPDYTLPQLFAPQLLPQPFVAPPSLWAPIRPFIVFDRPPRPPMDPEHNAKLTVGRLPPDIVADIFLLACEHSFAEYSWIVCSHVCMAWRQIALDTPLLWSHIVFKSRAWMNTCLERSRTSLLVIAADIRLALVETLVCDVLKMPDRIARIHLKLSVSSQPIVDLLPGPFPHLTHLSIEHNTWEVSHMPLRPDVPPFPALRSLFLRSNVSYLPPLPSQLVSLEIYYTGWELVPWDSFAPALCQLQQLHELKLSGFSDPTSSYVRQIPLPFLRDLHVSGSPKYCTQFIEALDSPKLRRFNLHLSNFDNLPALHRAVSLRMPKPPKCMMIDRDNGCNAGGNDLLLSMPLAANVQSASITFIYANERWPRDEALDACLSWIVPGGVHGDPALATIFAALSELVWLEHLERLGFFNWSTVPAALWRPFLNRLAGLQTLTVNDSPPAGLFWALVRDLESTHDVSASEAEEGIGGGGRALLPAMQTIKIIGVNCGAGSWLSQPRRLAVLPTHSYFDLDNTRFLELLICYLELRPSPLTKLVVQECFGYTGAEVKLLRRLVGSVLWDGLGMMEGVCWSNGDEVGALTINHRLIARQKGYEALNMSDEERWHEDAAFIWEVRPSTRLSDRLYVSCADSEVEE